jgi:tetratricopeptide (TPR) repeat protein
MDDSPKPKLLFLRFTRAGRPAFIRLHLREQVKCLSQFFDVVAIDNASDYRRLCDEHRPDLTIFESGVYVAPQDIANLDSYPEIPRLGFCHCDAYCHTRKLFISDMARFGVKTFFTTSVSLPSYTPSLAENIFVWPNFVDPGLYHDYGLPKLVPALFTGSQASHYPWRNRINRTISERYPSIQCPHSGWFEHATSRMISGEPYARMINASWIAPTCGTIANEVVRKHFEIPACNTCLVTQRTPALEAAGFADLVNCVFAEEAEVLEKVEWLFRHPGELEKITRAGYLLAHSQHTMRSRDQVFQWFTLNKKVKPHQRIVQLGPFLPLTVVDRDSQIKNGYVMSGGLDRALLAEGDEKLRSGQYDRAETLYCRCLNYHEIPEAKLRLALCYLYKGNPDLAIRLVSELIKTALEIWRVEPDPVEWAYLIVALLCRGNLREATARANQFELLCHPELERVREVIRMVNDQALKGIPLNRESAYRYSIHQLPERELETWLDDLRKMLQACQRDGLAEMLTPSGLRSALTTSVVEPNETPRQTALDLLRMAASCGAPKRRTELPGTPEVGRLKVADWRKRVKSGLGKFLRSAPLLPIRNLVWKLESKAGYFLPYKWSAIRFDEGVLAIRGLLCATDIKSGLLIGAAAGEGKTEAFLSSMGANPNKPRAVCMNFETPRFEKLQMRLANNPSVECRVISREVDAQKAHAESFDVVLIDGSEIVGEISYDNAHFARFIVLDDINTLQTFNFCQTLLADRNYTLLAHNPSHRDGYAIFRKVIIKE